MRRKSRVRPSQIYHAYFDGDQQRQQLITSQLVDFEHNMGFPYIPGFEAFVTSLRASGVRTAIVTSSASDKMANVYRAHPELIPYFDLILTAGDFPRSKPAPDCYLLAASRLGVAPADCVVFEDSINGLRSGRDSGASVVGLATTNPRRSRRSACGCSHPRLHSCDFSAVSCRPAGCCPSPAVETV